MDPLVKPEDDGILFPIPLFPLILLLPLFFPNSDDSFTSDSSLVPSPNPFLCSLPQNFPIVSPEPAI